jgi:hypothetical protein
MLNSGLWNPRTREKKRFSKKFKRALRKKFNEGKFRLAGRRQAPGHERACGGRSLKLSQKPIRCFANSSR